MRDVKLSGREAAVVRAIGFAESMMGAEILDFTHMELDDVGDTLNGLIAAGLVDHLHVVQVPILLGRGVRLWDGLEALEQQYDVEAVSTPRGVTHLTLTR